MNMYIDYDKGKVLGSKLQEEAKVLNELLNKLSEIHEKLEENVKEEIEEQYGKPLFSNIDMMKEFNELVNSTGSALSNISTAYIKVEKSSEVSKNEE